jgi:hypothetical protein
VPRQRVSPKSRWLTTVKDQTKVIRMEKKGSLNIGESRQRTKANLEKKWGSSTLWKEIGCAR